MLGLGTSAAGAALIGGMGAAATLLIGEGPTAMAVLVGAIAGGLSGSLVDSLLGATIQAIYWCDVCEKETEQRIHRCGTVTRQIRGFSWLGNDLVNLAASAFGAVVAAAIGVAFQGGR
jgi:uncharacterized membrane protein